MPTDTEREARYLYCIIRCSEERTFGGLHAIGDHGSPVRTVVLGDLACVVSDSPDTRYDSTRANMMAHETVIEGVMLRDGFTVLPIRFGTVTKKGASSPEEAIRGLLRKRFQEFQELYEELAGTVELGLKALWKDERAIFSEIVSTSGDIRRLRNALKGRSPEATHFDRMHLGEMVKVALDAHRDRDAKRILSPLRPLARRVRENKTALDRMVLNAAFLVDKAREEAFDQAVKRLDEELGDRMVFKYTGPNPPFNFCEIAVTWEEE